MRYEGSGEPNACSKFIISIFANLFYLVVKFIIIYYSLIIFKFCFKLKWYGHKLIRLFKTCVLVCLML